ncbi:MAG: ABC transporter ATP-binding protein, partial [Candidatus Bathyarchaeota archaeon]|nr:ABC transporter ATP-binding protein [Candidatus Bathyarchaeota archaeon]
MSVIEAVNVSKRFGEVEAVADVSLEVQAGEFFGLFGPNGAGKTTLLRMLTGQLEPDSGEIRTAGVPHGDPMGIKRVIGIVPEVEAPPTFLTAREYLELSCRIRGLDGVRGRVDRWLGFFEMGGMGDVLCRDLSKGQRQKVM